MHRLESKLPPPLVAGIFMAIMWFIARAGFVITMSDSIRYILSGALVCLGVSIGVSAILSFKRIATTIDPLKPDSATSLVTAGIYQYSRNPMYVGVAICLVAWAVYLSSVLALVGVVGFILYITRFQILAEERALMQLFPNAFAAYKKSVRRWL